MSKISLTDLANLQNENTAVSAINANNATIETAFENTLSRDGTIPNYMTAELDMNSNRIINLPAAISDTEPLRKGDLDVDVINGLTAEVEAAIAEATLATNAALAAATVVSGDIAAISSAFSAINFNNYGAKPATKGSGTVTVTSGAVVGSGTNFTTQFQVNDVVTFESTPITGAGYVTSQPINGDFVGTVPWASMFTGFGGADFTSLVAGDLINIPVYGAVGGFLTAGKSWPVNSVLNSTKLRTRVICDPQVGGGAGYPYVIVVSNSAYVVFPGPHGKTPGQSITITNSGNSSLNGTYTINQLVERGPTTITSTSFIVTTSGVPDGTYAGPTLTVTGIANSAVTAVVASNVATLTFLQPHGLSVGDSFTMAGWSGGATGLNNTFTVATIGTGDWPTTLTVTSSGVSNGTYTGIAVVAGTTWTYTQRPQQGVVTAIANDTHMTVSGISRDVPATSVIWKTPDNYTAFQAAIAASKANGLTLLIPSLAKTPQTPETRYYFDNSAANTGQSDGKITNTGFSQSVIFEGSAKFILNQSNPSYCGFEFNAGTNPKFINWTVETLYQVPWAPLITTFPFCLHLAGIDKPEIQGFTSLKGGANVLSVEFCRYPRIENVHIENCSGGLLLDNNIGFSINGVTVINSADEAVALYGAGLRQEETSSGILTNVYVRNGFHGLVSFENYGLNVSNFYLEGTAGVGLVIAGSSQQVSAKNVFSNGLLRRCSTLGPCAALSAQDAAVVVSDAVDTYLNNIHVRNHFAGDAFYSNRSFGITGILSINNCTAYDIPGCGGYLTTYGDLIIDNFMTKNTQDMGIYLASNDTVRMNHVTIDAAALTKDGGSTFGPNNALSMNSNANVIINGLSIKDRGTPSTGYKISELLTGGKVRIRTYDTDIATQPITWVINTPTKVFIDRSVGSSVASATTITPTGQIFPVSGTAAITTVNVPAGLQAGDYIVIVPKGVFTWTGTGNILLAGTAVVNKALTLTFDSNNWIPSYS